MRTRLWQLQYKSAPYVFILPYFILFSMFLLYPFAYSIYLSFMDWNGSGPKVFVGLDNYKLLLQSDTFWLTLWNGLMIFWMHVPIMLLLALLLAVFLNQGWMKARGFFRTVYFIPNITSVVAIAFVFVILLNTHDGLLNQILVKIGLIDEHIPWLESTLWARISLVLLILYRWTGYNMLLILAGLQNIPGDLYEAAKVDGANPFQTFVYITVPQLRKILIFCTVLSTIGSFSLFTEPLILTKGGPMDSTLTTIYLIYRESFQNLYFGYASAISVAYFLLMMGLTIFQLRLFDTRD